ncbi:MAG: two-component system response regulator [Xanthobacteraceae bacterium]|nr:two-component system response regulator [Xanthobacteraceae bacterium]
MAVNLSMPILVVEDHNATSLILRTMLNHLGFKNIDEASDGSAALAMMREKKYTLVISDWNMEPMTGHELLKEVRADEQLAKCRFVIVTSNLSSAHVVAAKKAKVDNYIVKPFSTDVLRTKIGELFAE